MIEALEAGGGPDFFLQFVDRAGGVDGGDGPALGADEVVAMIAGDDECKVGGPFVESESPDDAFVGEAEQEAAEGGFVAEGGRREVGTR